MGRKIARARFSARIFWLLIAATLWPGQVAADATFMITGKRTSQPIGHLNFCKLNPEECAVRSPVDIPERQTPELRSLLASVNLSVNEAVKPKSDLAIYGKDEVWAYPDQEGDCEDYVLLKRRNLLEQGLLPSNLLITVVRLSNGEGHAVLTVRTDRGDFILDNLTDQVSAWEKTEYRYIKRQASDDTGRWVAIHSGDDTSLVGAIH